MYFKSKKLQSEVITTVLLILISIAAVVLVSTFVINMVRSNLVSTDCFKTTGQFKINLGEGFTYFNSSGNVTFISISRGEDTFNLTGILISAGTGQTSSSYTIKAGDNGTVRMWDNSSIELPNPSETRTYRINNGKFVDKVKIIPMLYPAKACKEGVDEQDIPSK
jgi:hypothetical protein